MATQGPLPPAAGGRSSATPLTDDSVALTSTCPPSWRRRTRTRPASTWRSSRPALADGDRRSYSICAPGGLRPAAVGIKLLPGGGVLDLRRRTRLQPGDVLEVLTPVGRFGPRPVDSATGRALVRRASPPGAASRRCCRSSRPCWQRSREARVTLLYGNRTSRSVMFAEELEDLKDRYPDRFQLLHLLTREPGTVDLLSGRLDGPRLERLLDTLVPPDDVDEWFLCGPHGMVVELRDDAARARGVPPAHVHTELFHADADPAAGARVPRRRRPRVGAAAPRSPCCWTVAARRVRLPVDGAPVLEAALAVRADAPFSCRGGVCGTCRARVVEGAVSMDHNYALEPDEIERGYVLTCQSHPTSDRVVVDFDA